MEGKKNTAIFLIFVIGIMLLSNIKVTTADSSDVDGGFGINVTIVNPSYDPENASQTDEQSVNDTVNQNDAQDEDGSSSKNNHKNNALSIIIQDSDTEETQNLGVGEEQTIIMLGNPVTSKNTSGISSSTIIFIILLLIELTFLWLLCYYLFSSVKKSSSFSYA